MKTEPTIFESAGVPMPEEKEPEYDYWLVAAWWKSAPGGWWKVFPDMWLNEEAAKKQVVKIQEAGWRFAKLIHFTNRANGN